MCARGVGNVYICTGSRCVVCLFFCLCVVCLCMRASHCSMCNTHSLTDTRTHTFSVLCVCVCIATIVGLFFPLAGLFCLYAQSSRNCAPGSTIKPCSCSREHKQAVFVLPGAQSSDVCAPGSTSEKYLCSREHSPFVLVLPGAQSSDVCALGNRIQR